MILAVDTETTGTDRWHGCKPFLVTACDGHKNYYVKGEVDHYNRATVVWCHDDLYSLQEKLEAADKLIFHNAKFDLHMLASIGIDLSRLWPKVEDTLLANHVLCSGESHKLKDLADKYLDYDTEDEDELADAVKAARINSDFDIAREGHPCFPGLGGSSKNVQWYKMDYWLCPELCLKYGMGDVERTLLLWEVFYEAIEKHNLVTQYETRKELIKICYDIECAGYNMYADGVKAEIARLIKLKQEVTKKIMKSLNISGHFDLSEEKTLRYFLFQVLGIKPIVFTEKRGEPSIAKDAIEGMIEDHPEIPELEWFQEYRIATTQIGYLSSYDKWVCEDGRIRSSIFITGTRETRQSVKDPNTQNIDKRLTGIFGPPPGKVWLDFDLVNIELRIWVYEVGNPELKAVFERGDSVHLLVASIIHPKLYNQLGPDGFKERIMSPHNEYTRVKNGNFAIIYGASANRANKTYGVEGAYELIADRFPEVPAYSQLIMNEAWHNLERHNAPYVTCIGGYRLDVNMDEPYTACNYKIQGTAGYIVNEAMINIKRNEHYNFYGCEMIQQVHDSIKVEVDECEPYEDIAKSINHSIELAGLKYLPTCKASYKIIHNTEAPF
jgi:DNA polymerase I-like protein with 3'-5' exonuclease and polymerase domains